MHKYKNIKSDFEDREYYSITAINKIESNTKNKMKARTKILNRKIYE